MTTIEETIDLFEKKAENEKERAFNDAVFWNKDTEYAQYCRKLSSEYLQLAEWLKELQAHREAWELLKEDVMSKYYTYKINMDGHSMEMMEEILGLIYAHRPKKGNNNADSN